MAYNGGSTMGNDKYNEWHIMVDKQWEITDNVNEKQLETTECEWHTMMDKQWEITDNVNGIQSWINNGKCKQWEITH